MEGKRLDGGRTTITYNDEKGSRRKHEKIIESPIQKMLNHVSSATTVGQFSSRALPCLYFTAVLGIFIS